MKIALLGDTHFGARNNSEIFQEYFNQFFDEVFFPALEKHGVEYVFQLGDLFDKRRSQDVKTFYNYRKKFFERFDELNIQCIIFPGNHDIYYKNTNRVNSLSEFVRGFNRVKIVEDFTEVNLGGVKFALFPWINSENYNEAATFLKNTNADIALGHFEIQGFRMMKGGMKCENGMKPSHFNKFEWVFSGHFHHPSIQNNICYVGAPYEMNWGDEGDQKQFLILDTEDISQPQQIVNPLTIYKKSYYDDSEGLLDWNILEEVDFSYYKGKFVKIIVQEINDQELFDEFINRIVEQQPLELQIQNDVSQTSVNKETGDAEDTLSTIVETVKEVEDEEVDSRILEKIMKNVYNEALEKRE